MADGDLQPPIDPTTNMGITSQSAPDFSAGAGGQMPQLAPQPIQRPGGGRLPLLAQMLAETFRAPTQVQADPGQLATVRPVSRAGEYEGFLAQFLQALGQGFANEGRGPGSFYRGFGAAQQAPQQYAMQQAQFGQQMQENQARMAGQQAQTQLTQAQLAGLPAEQQAKLAAMTAQPRWDPNTRDFLGTMTDAAFANYVKGQGAAKQNALSKQAQADLAAGKVAKYLPTPDGRYLALDAKGQPLHVVDGTIDPQMMQRYSSTQKLVPDGVGGYSVVPVTTTSGVAMTPQARLQAQVPALAASQSPQTQLQNKVPALANAANSPAASSTAASSPRHIYGQGPVIAFDPSAGQQVLTTGAEVAQKGFQNPRKVSQTDIEKEQAASSMISDVQLNKSRYAAAMNQFYREPVTGTQAQALAALVPEKLGIDIGHGFGLSLPDAIQKLTNATEFSLLSPTQKKGMIGYYSTLASVPAYQKALSNIGRSNKEMMDLELRTVPTPLMDKETFGLMLDRFQGNIDAVGRRTVRFPGIDSVQDVRQKYEGAPTNRPGQFEAPTDLLQRLGIR